MKKKLVLKKPKASNKKGNKAGGKTIVQKPVHDDHYVSQREQEYEQARARIFAEMESHGDDTSTIDHSNDADRERSEKTAALLRDMNISPSMDDRNNNSSPSHNRGVSPHGRENNTHNEKHLYSRNAVRFSRQQPSSSSSGPPTQSGYQLQQEQHQQQYGSPYQLNEYSRFNNTYGAPPPTHYQQQQQYQHFGYGVNSTPSYGQSHQGYSEYNRNQTSAQQNYDNHPTPSLSTSTNSHEASLTEAEFPPLG